MTDREEIERIASDRNAVRWNKLMRLIGTPANASDETVKMFWDDATMTAHIQVGKEVYGTDHGSFEAVIDSIDWPEW